MALGVMRGTHWTPAELAWMKDVPKQPLSINRIRTTPLPVALFPADGDKDTGFMFDVHEWMHMWDTDDWRRWVKDATAHREEAQRRMVVCRLDERGAERAEEIAYWKLWIERFTKYSRLPELKDGD